MSSERSVKDLSGLYTGLLVGAVGIELKATLKARKLLIPLNGRNAKNIKPAQVRYTAGTRNLCRNNCKLITVQRVHVDLRFRDVLFAPLIDGHVTALVATDNQPAVIWA